MNSKSYTSAAARLRHYADQIERYGSAKTPRERAHLTRAIHGASLYAQALSRRHRESQR